MQALEPDRKVYIFVDHDNLLGEANSDVKVYANKLCETGRSQTNIQELNLGPGKAMIEALDWIFKSEEVVWILEDDVFPNDFAGDYINFIASQVKQDMNLVATARSPFTSSGAKLPNDSGISKFPLTNGWVLSREVWILFKIHLRNPLIKDFTKFAISNPCSIRREHFYFYAASLMSRSELVKAWDTQFLFFCLLNNIKSITPNRSCIEIRGVDEVASNTVPTIGVTDEVFWRADLIAPSHNISFDKSISDQLDSVIKEDIYKMRWWHVFSPIRSYLRIIKKRFV